MTLDNTVITPGNMVHQSSLLNNLLNWHALALTKALPIPTVL